MRLTNQFSVMGRKYDLAYGQANIWKRKLKNDKYELIENAVDKLGQLEDIEEKYNIKSFDDLDKKLEALDLLKSTSMLSVFQDIKGDYYLVLNNTAIHILQKEYDLLKEVL